MQEKKDKIAELVDTTQQLKIKLALESKYITKFTQNKMNQIFKKSKMAEVKLHSQIEVGACFFF